jgi:predicted O-methyltransferase YrrM
MIDRILHRLSRLSLRTYGDLGIRPTQEQTYRFLFVRDLARAGIEDTFYPVGNAANYSLLYLLARCLRELPISRVAEFGTGQSSLLIDKLVGDTTTVTSFEHDQSWAEMIAKKVRHRVVVAPLVETPVDDHRVMFYDPVDFTGVGHPDLILIDGPTACHPPQPCRCAQLFR